MGWPRSLAWDGRSPFCAPENCERVSRPSVTMRVKEVAEQASVSPEVVRYYVRIGLLKPAGSDKSGYRRFSASHLNMLRFIMRAKQLGFTLSEIAEILRMAHRGKTPCP